MEFYTCPCMCLCVRTCVGAVCVGVSVYYLGLSLLCSKFAYYPFWHFPNFLPIMPVFMLPIDMDYADISCFQDRNEIIF